MPSLGRDLLGSDPPDQVCVRCSKPITLGTAAQLAGRPVHMRCLARVVQLEVLEERERIKVERLRARAARTRAEELIDTVPRAQSICPGCGEPLGTSRGVLFQGDWLVHVACWREDPEHLDDPPPVA